MSEVNHPEHYTGQYECIDVMEDTLGVEVVKGFCVGNAMKYIWRCNSKHDSPIEDIKKAKWYLEKYIEIAERG